MPTLFLAATPYLNLALRNNLVPPVRTLRLSADLETEPEAAGAIYEVSLDCRPAVIQSVTWHGLQLNAAGELNLPLDTIALDYAFLATLTEAIPASITVSAYPTHNPKALLQQRADIRVLPPSHWGGFAVVPELLAAHVLPNDPAIASLLKRAAELLEKSGQALSAYQSEKPKAAAAQFVAILTVICERGLHYASAPGSFEAYGQKIRTPHEVLTYGLGNCLDLSCLAAAALEQAGLNPIVVLVQGHAYLACWLQPSPLATGVVDDPQVLRKALGSNLLLCAETILLVGAAADVNAAISAGHKQLLESSDFSVAIDLHAARRGEKITPLNFHFDQLATHQNAPQTPVRTGGLDLSAIAHFGEGQLREESTDAPAAIPTGARRVNEWKARLLNLTRRNNLLNYRLTGGALHLRFIAPAAMEDFLATGKQMRLEPLDEQRAQQGDLGRKLQEDHYAEAIQNGVKTGRLLVIGRPESLSTNLLKLERAARTALEEGGANILYVALGFAVKPRPGRPPSFRPGALADERPEYAAPLILLPVDLKRRGAGSTFSIVLRDEEALLNPTLIEFLKREAKVDLAEYAYSLPTDESGLDVDHILGRVKQELLNVPGWEITEDIALGLFSFSKYLMWRDLDAFEPELKRNPVVAHLIDTPREPYFDPTAPGVQAFPRAETLDETFPVGEMLTPMSADSSQLAAIRAAAQGIDFILEGPPGTGKSQTITNLIAQLMGEGKRVLFVSEKTAALDVVQRRLDAIGLGEFCLELHANNGTKGAVYDQLREALEANPAMDSPFYTTAQQLGTTRATLNATIAALHAPTPSGRSVYAATAYAAPRSALLAPAPAPEKMPAIDAAWVQHARELVRRLVLHFADVSPAARAALHPLNSAVEAATFADVGKRLLEAAGQFEKSETEFLAQLHLPPERVAQDQGIGSPALQAFAELVVLAEDRDYTDLAETIESGRARRAAALETEAAFALLAAFAHLRGSYRPEVLEFDVVAAAATWQQSEQAFFLLKWWRQYTIRRKLRAYATVETPEVGADLQQLATIKRRLAELSAPVQQHFRLAEHSVSELRSRAEFASAIDAFVEADYAAKLGLTSEKARAVLSEMSENNALARQLLGATQTYLAAVLGADAGAREYIKARDGRVMDGPLNISFTALGQEVAAILHHERDWRPWGLFAEARNAARAHGLGYFVDAPEAALDQGTDVALERFELGLSRVVAQTAIRENSLLRTFSGTAFQDLIEQFGVLDEDFLRAVTLEIRTRLAERRKGIYRQEFRQPLGLLHQELQKKRRQMPVRQLIKQLGGLLPELTPCLLMSPLSIAQYLPADAEAVRFDVVVFDEASQIPTWDAIGAIARGKQVVVVGDSRQLPPTSFFGSGGVEEIEEIDGDEPQVVDLESILDELKAAQLRTWRLRWHYRSQAESLIAFSNRTYYEGHLNTFPAPLAEDQAVAWHKVGSRDYLKGRNLAEGKELVRYLLDRLRASSPQELTFGVVTFGQAQQTLIEDLLEEARRTDPAVECYFQDGLDERLFVKNIENVQGDERDVILFSLTYGPDQAGKTVMRFGPMNQAGGERRLNVAITRARREMHLFSSMEPEDIDLSRLGENAQGARDLRQFMEFAKHGAKAFGERLAAGGKAHTVEVPFEQAVANALRARGFETDIQVGVSGYQIDLGVHAPRKPGRYLAGVECDGASYQGTASARERDLLRQRILESLGWTILRVWSIDWWNDPERTADKLAERLRRIARGEDPEEAQARRPNQAVKTLPTAVAHQKEGAASPRVNHYRRTVAADLLELRQQATKAVPDYFGLDAFYHEKSAKATGKMIATIVEREAPILVSELIIRVSAEGYGFGRAGSKIRAVIEALIPRHAYPAENYGEQVAWRNPTQAEAPVHFRPPAPGDAARGITEIPLVELIALARTYITRGLDENELVRAMGNEITLSSVRGEPRKRILRAVEFAWALGEE